MRRPFMLLVMFFSIASARSAEVVVEDIFGRRLNESGLILVDWEGPIANPAIKFLIVPPGDAAFPARAVLTSTEQRVYFNLPSEIGANGPRKFLEFKNREKLSLLASIFSDWEGTDCDVMLQLDFEDALGRKQVLKLPCHVIDQDKKDQKAYPITIDFSQDRTGFFKDEKKRQVV